jgi:hypothetical protein
MFQGKINGVQHYLWLAVDQHDAVIDRRHGRIASTHGGKPSQLEVHSAKKLYHHFLLVEQLKRPRRSSPAQLDSALDGIGPMNARVQARRGYFLSITVNFGLGT